MKKNLFFIILLNSCLFFSNTQLYSQSWTLQTSGTTKELYSVYFLNTDTGFAVGDFGTILKTNNGGANWSSINSGTTEMLRSIFFTDDNIGYVVGGGGKILKTTNGGLNWSSQISGTTEQLNSVYFANASIGYIVGSNGKILCTYNSGTNWSPQFSGGTNPHLYSVYFTNLNTGYAVGSGGTILMTINNGTTWSPQTSGTSSWLSSVFFSDANTGYTVGGAYIPNTILQTTDGGSNWTAQSSGTSEFLTSIYFLNNNIGYTVGSNGTILKTTNGGVNWLPQTSGTSSYLTSVYFLNANIGYVVGDYGTIIKTTNGGLNTIITVQPAAHICYGDSVTLTANVFGSSPPYSYIWSNSDTISSIKVSPTINTNYSVTVSDLNGGSSTYNVTITVDSVPSFAETITGLTPVCQGQNSVTYNVPAITNATSYIWTLPSGATGSSTTNSITVNYGSSAVSGDITVKGNNSCGNGAMSTISITVNNKPTTPVINLNVNILNSDATTGNQWYNQNGLINGATNQNYTPLINGEYYSIVTINGCSSNPSNTIHVTITGIEQNEFSNSIKFYPNPVTNELIIQNEEIKSNIEFEIINTIGQTIFKGKLTEKTIVPTTNLVNGIYLIKLSNGKTFEFKKIVKE